MKPVESLITGSEKLADVFGRWPSFHDAEVTEFNLHRGAINLHSDQWLFPTVVARIRVWELIQEVNSSGHLVTRNHSVVTLRFIDLDELKLVGFNHQNAILSLTIEQRERADGPSPYFFVDFRPAYGLDATFHCRGIEVLDIVPCHPTTPA